MARPVLPSMSSVSWVAWFVVVEWFPTQGPGIPEARWADVLVGHVCCMCPLCPRGRPSRQFSAAVGVSSKWVPVFKLVSVMWFTLK